jgi:serine/threonine-protein kinase
VTHPNVCRVFDIGQIEEPAAADRPGLVRQFISMEYVDGEDLASLLRRIGRLPEDKAVEIARQLCAGWPPRTTKACCIAISNLRT